MSTLRVSNIEAKADASSPTIDEKVKITSSDGRVLVQVDGKTAGITSIGINTTSTSFTIDGNQNVQFVGVITAANVNTTGVSTFTRVNIGSGTSISSPATNVLTLGTNNTESVRINSTGVGIGTNNPTTTLDVGGEITIRRTAAGNEGGQINFARASDNAVAWNIDAYGSTSTPSLRFIDATAGASRVEIDSSGNLKLPTAGTKILNSSGNPILQQTGGILQVVQTVKSDIFSNSTRGSYVAVTGLSATITPTSTTSKILIMSEVCWDTLNNYPVLLHIYRNGAQITPNGNSTGYTPSTAYNTSQQPADTRSWYDQQTLIYLDSPGSTSSLTYQIYAAKPSAAVTNIVINSWGSSNITLMEIAG